MNKRIKKVRHELKLTQGQFGKRLGLKGSQVKDIETGVVKIRPMLVRLLSHEFMVDSKWLMTGKGRMFGTACEEERQMSCGADHCEKFLKILSEGDTDSVNALKHIVDFFYNMLLKNKAIVGRKKINIGIK